MCATEDLAYSSVNEIIYMYQNQPYDASMAITSEIEKCDNSENNSE